MKFSDKFASQRVPPRSPTGHSAPILSQTDMETPDDTVSIALRVCYHCGKAEDEQLKLRKCSGCSSALYCSKECQKEQWKTHKSVLCDLPGPLQLTSLQVPLHSR